MRRILFVLSIGLATTLHAQEIVVSWASNGVLQATGMEPGTAYTLEWAPNLQSGFVTNDAPFADLIVGPNGVGVVEIPMFFRVRGTPKQEIPLGMVLIPAGTNSGTNLLGAGESYGIYYPQTYSLTVTNAFYMDATEVTKATWDSVYNWAVANGYSFTNAGAAKASDHPVQMVNWHDCVKWCNARSEMTGKTPCYSVSGSTYKTGESAPTTDFAANGYRLPTSDEWEYAARGGVSGTRFSWGDTINHDNANYAAIGSAYSYDTTPYTSYTFHPDYDDGGHPYTSPVGDFSPNGYGLYDMAGNVSELCDTAQDSTYRIYRGGNWLSTAITARCGQGGGANAAAAYNSVGFRSICR